MPHARRQQARAQLAVATDRLLAEFAGVVPASVVMSVVSRCQQELREQGVGQQLAEATEMLARLRLAQRTPAHGAA
jgi:hypothetical protein